jgi:hypothetical protein
MATHRERLTRSGHRSGRRLAAPVALVLSGALLLGASVDGLLDSGPPPAPPAPVVQAEGGRPDGSEVEGPSLPAAEPVAVRVEEIGVESELVDLGLDGEGRLEVPEDADIAGWYVKGPTPGERGPAVIVGHVDSHHGPGVFYRLGELRPGDEVEVERADGRTARFRVYRVEQVPKDDFPTQRVYGPTDGAELRLITCGGQFDRSSRHYTDNIVVYAELADAESAALTTS